MAAVLSCLTADDLAKYLKIEAPEYDVTDPMLEGMLAAARAAVLGYTGMEMDEADIHPEIALAALVVAADLYEHRTMQIDGDDINKTARALMDLHRSNLI